jgi:hypothetical protein
MPPQQEQMVKTLRFQVGSCVLGSLRKVFMLRQESISVAVKEPVKRSSVRSWAVTFAVAVVGVLIGFAVKSSYRGP